LPRFTFLARGFASWGQPELRNEHHRRYSALELEAIEHPETGRLGQPGGRDDLAGAHAAPPARSDHAQHVDDALDALRARSHDSILWSLSSHLHLPSRFLAHGWA
jgi:hypothetical protein